MKFVLSAVKGILRRSTALLSVITISVIGVHLLTGAHAATSNSGPLCSPSPCTLGVNTAYTINVDDGAGQTVTRTFYLERPTHLVNSANNLVPVVFQFVGTQNWQGESPTGEFIVVNIPTIHPYSGCGTGGCQYADGIIAPHTYTGFNECGTSGTAQCDDLPWVQTLMQDLVSCSTAHGLTAPCQNIDPNQIYATGGSRGGTMAEAVMCDPLTSTLINGVAPVSALIGAYNSGSASSTDSTTWPNCPSMLGQSYKGTVASPNLNMTGLWIYGDSDGNFVSSSCTTRCLSTGYLGNSGNWAWGDDQMISQLFANPRGCATSPTDSLVQGVSQVIQHLYACSSSGRAFGTIEVTNGGHQPEGSTADGVTFAPVIWNFFTTYKGTPSTPAPTVTLTALPTSVTSGGSSTLTWSTTNATSCTASGGWSGSQATSGSTSTGALSADTTYNLSCTGTGGSASAAATVTVTGSPPPPTPPTAAISAAPTSVNQGDSSTLTWSTTNATSCTASGGWSGSQATSGTASTGALSADTTFTLDCTGSGGSTQVSATVTVNSTPVTVIGGTGSGGGSSSSTPVVSGTITLKPSVPNAKSVHYVVDGTPITSNVVNTNQLADGNHTVESVVTENNGKVVTKKQTIKVNNHHSFLANLKLRFGLVSMISTFSVALLAIAGGVFYVIYGPQKIISLAHQILNNLGLRNNLLATSSGPAIQTPAPIITPPPTAASNLPPNSPIPGSVFHPTDNSDNQPQS